MPELCIESTPVGRWNVSVVQFFEENVRSLAVPVDGINSNSIPTTPTGRQRLVDWKQNVAQTVKAHRGPNPRDPSDHYAISVGFSFCLGAHGNRPLDVENFVKPTLDALAAGLFCMNDQDVSTIERYDFDDSNFRYLFVYRLDDAPSSSEEGVGVYVSIRG